MSATNPYRGKASDYEAGYNDCKNGIFDRWYYYNRTDDGRAYEEGWRARREVDTNDYYTIIGDEDNRLQPRIVFATSF